MHNNTELGISVPMYDAITEIKEAEEILKHMNNTFSDSLRYILNYLGNITISDLSKQTKIETKTIRRYLKGETTPNLERLLAICAELELYPSITKRLLEQAGIIIGKRGNEKDEIYLFLIEQCYHEGLESWNKWLKTVCEGEYLP